MRVSSLKAFEKNLACPSSRLLQMSVSSDLSPEIKKLIDDHVETCEFCGAELELLTRHPIAGHADIRTPEVPINLRILAESLLSPMRPPSPQARRRRFFEYHSMKRR